MSTTTQPPSLFARLAKLGAREVIRYGQDVEIEIVEMSFADRSSLADIHRAGGDEETVGTKFVHAILMACCYEPGTNTKLFSDASQFGQLPYGLVLKLAEDAKRINGLTPKPELEPDPEADEAIHPVSEAEKNA